MRLLVIVMVGVWSVVAHGDDRLVIHYDFSEGAGTVLHDKTGNGNNAAIHGATWVKAEGLWALAFDGIDDYVDCGAGKHTDLTDQISVEVWARPEKTPAAGEAGIVGKDFESYGLTYATSGCWWYISGGSNQCVAPLPSGMWHHIVGTFDGARLGLYIDGKLVAGRASKTQVINHGQNLLMGFNTGSERYVRNAHFCGLIGDVRIYNRALSDAEVHNHYRTTRLTHPFAAMAHRS